MGSWKPRPLGGLILGRKLSSLLAQSLQACFSLASSTYGQESLPIRGTPTSSTCSSGPWSCGSSSSFLPEPQGRGGGGGDGGGTFSVARGDGNYADCLEGGPASGGTESRSPHRAS